MLIDENEFFRQATIRICSHLNIQTALRNAHEYISAHIPAGAMYLFHHDEKLNSLRTIAEAPRSRKPRLNKLTPFPPEFMDDYFRNAESAGVAIVNVPGSNRISDSSLRTWAWAWTARH